MATNIQLSAGHMMKMMTDSEYNEQPVFQVTFVEKLARRSNDRTDIARYRLHLSDGLKFCMFTSLAQSVNDMVSDGRITLYSVIRLIKYRTHLVKMANCIEMLKVLDVYGVVVLCGNQDKINGDALKYWQPEFCAAEVVTPLIFTDIDALTPELPKWYVKARVTARSEVYTTNDGRDWYKVDLLDKKGGAIHCTVFSEQFDRMKNVLVVGRTYSFTRCEVRVADGRYNELTHKFELIVKKGSVVANQRED